MKPTPINLEFNAILIVWFGFTHIGCLYFQKRFNKFSVLCMHLVGLVAVPQNDFGKKKKQQNFMKKERTTTKNRFVQPAIATATQRHTVNGNKPVERSTLTRHSQIIF